MNAPPGTVSPITQGMAVLCLMLGAGLGSAADDLKVAARKRARQEAVQRAGIERALSKEMPQSVQDLQVFGTIEWSVREIPFVGAGPYAGISGMGMAAVDGQIYLMGGFIPAGDGTDGLSRRTSRWAHRYDPEAECWERLPDMPERREYTRAIGTDNEIYVLGGAIQGRPTVPSADVFRLDLSEQPLQWRQVGPLTVPRTHMAVGRSGHCLIVAGGNRYDVAEKGYSNGTIQGITDVLDLTKPEQGWKQYAPIPGRPRGWTAASVLDGKLFVFGGLTFTQSGKETRSPRAKIQETLSYDPVQDKWMRLADPPVPISGWQSAVYGNRYIIIIGGVSTHWNDVPFVYDAGTDHWLRIDSPLPPGGLFNDSGVCIIGETIYVAGGEGPGGSHFNHFLVGRIRANPGAK